MEVLKIDQTDIILDDEGDGRGKITISNTYGYNYSTYWGSMGKRGLKEFLLGMNNDYFINRLVSDTGVFCGKKSVKNVRRFIREEMSYELPWYKFMKAQKELRERLKELESCDSDRDFVSAMSNLSGSLYCLELSYDDEKEFNEILGVLETEPWHFIDYKPSNDVIFLERLFPKLQKKLKK